MEEREEWSANTKPPANYTGPGLVLVVMLLSRSTADWRRILRT